MKTCAMTAMLLLYSAASSALTGDEFQRECVSDPSYCRGYVQGVVDARTTWVFAYDRDPAHPKGKTRTVGKRAVVQSEGEKLDLHGLPWIPTRYCAPAGVTLSQLQETALRYIVAHPGAVDDPADRLIAAALISAFPCP